MAERTERAVLNHLIETCKDGERGFLNAASHVESPKLKATFEQMAARRASFAAELAPHANRLGGEGGSEGSSAAALHRKWIDIKSMLKRHDDSAILVEVGRGDGITLHAFRDALDGMLPPDSRDLIEKIYGELRAAHATIESLGGVVQA